MKLFSTSHGGARAQKKPAQAAVPAQAEVAVPVQMETVVPVQAQAAQRGGVSPAAVLAALVLTAAMLAFAGVCFHFSTAAAAVARDKPTAVLHPVQRFAGAMNNAKSDALSDLVYIPKVYTIEESATAAPRPDPACYGVTTDPGVIRALIDGAAELLDGQATVWNEDVKLLPGSEYNYYYDETILVITWKEIIDNKACTCSEIKIAHPSQLRRKITGDVYDSPIRLNCSELARQANAVIAMNADFYGFRSIGITVYDRTLYRCEGDKIDTCFFNSNGEMVMVRAGALGSREETEQFLRDQDILFSTSFGPVLIENGVKEVLGSYPIGEVFTPYSRAAIGTAGPLHYFFLNINYDTGCAKCATISQLQDILWDKGLENAYTLDGGQTSEVFMNEKMINHVDWGAERAVSDILYFATALPEKEG